MHKCICLAKDFLKLYISGSGEGILDSYQIFTHQNNLLVCLSGNKRWFINKVIYLYLEECIELISYQTVSCIWRTCLVTAPQQQQAPGLTQCFSIISILKQYGIIGNISLFIVKMTLVHAIKKVLETWVSITAQITQLL